MIDPNGVSVNVGDLVFFVRTLWRGKTVACRGVVVSVAKTGESAVVNVTMDNYGYDDDVQSYSGQKNYNKWNKEIRVKRTKLMVI